MYYNFKSSLIFRNKKFRFIGTLNRWIILHILQHFVPKLCIFTNFEMLFNAVAMNCTISRFLNILSIRQSVQDFLIPTFCTLLQVYIRRSYEAYELTTLQHEQVCIYSKHLAHKIVLVWYPFPIRDRSLFMAGVGAEEKMF